MTKNVLMICFILFFVSCAFQSRQAAPPKRIIKKVPNQRIHFPFDNEYFYFEEIVKLAENSEWLKENRDAVIILEGHCDETGPSKYNMELGDHRARNVEAYLIEKGIGHERIIMVVSYGERRPIETAHNKEAWRANRRVEFIVR